jgi:hypothetical protein
MNNPPEIKLQRDKNGFPLLPKWDKLENAQLDYKKRLIGKFMTDIYGASTTLFYHFRLSSPSHFSEITTGNEGARVLWASLQREPTRYIDPKYLP